MLLDSNLKKLLTELSLGDAAEINLGGGVITVKVLDRGEKLFLTTPVYFGGNYIPKSVRNCLKVRAPFDAPYLHTSMRIDEDNFKIYLNYFGKVTLSKQSIVDTLEEFSGLASKWRDYLDEHDKNDLVYVRQAK